MKTKKNNAPLEIAPPSAQEESAESFSFEKLKPKVKPIWKVVFIVVMVACIGASLYFSFSALSQDTYTYKQTDNGWQLYSFINNDNVSDLYIDYVVEEDGSKNESKPIAVVREFALTCDEYVTDIYIGKDVIEIQEEAFYYCKNLMAFHVDPQNTAYCSVNGILFNKDMTEIIQFPINYVNNPENTLVYAEEDDVKYMKYTIPDGVTKICSMCFAYLDDMTEITIPEGVKEIGTEAFFKCKNLETMNLPDSIEFLGADVFSYCKKLTYVYIPSSIKEIDHHAFCECANMELIEVGLSEEEFEENVITGDLWCNIGLIDKIKVSYGCSRRQA